MSLVVLGTLAIGPGVAQAGVGAGGNITFPGVATVGESGLPASIEMTNLNSGPDSTLTNSVCNPGDPNPPCDGAGIRLVPSCSAVAAGTCLPAGADPGVFSLSATGTGALGTACAGMVFDVIASGDAFGAVRFVPRGGGHIALAGFGATCRIDFALAVLRSPADQDPGTPGAQTVATATSTQWVGTAPPTGGEPNGATSTSASATVLRAPPPPVTPLSPVTPPSPVTPQGPRILSAVLTPGAEVGRIALLKVRAVDPSRPVSGLEVHFGEPRGRVGRSACSVPSFGPSIAPVTQTVPYAFRRPGPHRITIDVLSGSCAGAPRRASTTIEVDVDPRHSAPPPAAPGRCADRRLEPTTAKRPRVAAAVLCLVNVERRRRGRPNLRRSPRLARAAANHSRDMLKRRFHGHEGPGGPSLRARLRRVGYRGTTYGENTAYRDDATAERIVRDWMNSHGHKSNILQPRLRFAGVGIVIGIPVTPRLPGSTYTMDFGATIR